MTLSLITRTTSRVEHLGVWAYDRSSGSTSWDTGRSVPICGMERNHGSWTMVDWPKRRVPLSMSPHRRKPLCKRCVSLLGLLVELAASRTETADEPLPMEAPDGRQDRH